MPRGGWRRLRSWRGAICSARSALFIMVLFVLAAVFADLICRFDPLTINSAHALAAPSCAALARHRFVRPRRLEPHHPRRAHFARGRHRLDRAGLVDRRDDRAGVGLSVRLGRSGVPARHRYHAVAAAAGAGAGHDGGARAVAAQRHHRDRDPAGPDRRPRHPRQHPGAARVAVCRGRASRSA